MTYQSAHHVLLVEPVNFFTNIETMATNPYQVNSEGSQKEIQQQALIELRRFRDTLIEKGITVTVTQGNKHTPDDVFSGNCYATFQDSTVVIFPMMAKNRRLEKTESLTNLITSMYENVIDYSDYEQQGLFLESTGSMVMDHVNRLAYATQSDRTNLTLLKKWCESHGYQPIIFHSQTHTGQAVYHTDLILYIGTSVAGFVSGCVDDETERKQVLQSLSRTHEVVEFTKEQLKKFVGNAIELRNKDNEKHLLMSDTAYQALTKEQLAKLSPHFKEILHPSIPTIEKFGGGSARCLILELF